METGNKPKIWQTTLLLAAAMLGLFLAGGYAQMRFGMYGVLVTESIMLALALLFVILTKGSLKDAFKFEKPTFRKTWGSILIYFGAYIIIMAVSVLVSYLMPEASGSVSKSLYYFFTNDIPPLATFLILTVPPAFCEEMLFRGAVVYGLKGLKRYAVVMIVGIVFGIFHTSIIRFFPTAILGIAFTFVYMKTENLFYPMLLHFMNNAFSAVAVLLMSDPSVYEASYTGSVPLVSVGIYFIFCAASPFLIKAGVKKFEPKRLSVYRYAPNLGEEELKELERRKKMNRAAVLCSVIFAVSGAGVVAADRYARTDILDVKASVYVDYDDKEVVNIDFNAEKDDIFYFEYDIKAQRGLAEVIITSSGGEDIVYFPVRDESGGLPLALSKGDYSIKIYSHVGDLWDYCRQNNLPYTEEGDLIKLNMAGDPNEKSEISYAFRIK